MCFEIPCRLDRHSRAAESIYRIHPSRVLEFLPTYDRSRFQNLKPKEFSVRPFTVLYCGRIEINRGVFDFVEVIRRLVTEYPDEFRFHYCGTGCRLGELRAAASEQVLLGSVLVHGHCNVEEMTDLIGQSHVIVVPTRTEFEEGFWSAPKVRFLSAHW